MTSHRRNRKAIALIAGVMLLIPLTAMAGSVFDDVDDTDVHIDGITFVRDTGISIGCDAANNFCPDDPVTRAQMATFMHRLSGNDPDTNPAVDADRLDGFDANELIRASFDTVDSGALLGTDGVAAETTMVAPTDGILIIRASSDVESSSTGDTIFCEIQMNGDLINSSRRAVHVDFPDQPVDICATDTAVEVEAGTHTIEYVFSGLLATSVVDQAVVTVLYVPFSGSAPSIVAPPPPPPVEG